MKKFTLLFAIIVCTINLSAVDIVEHFSTQSTGHYYPYTENGTFTIQFDFELQNGPINHNFTVGFYLSNDLVIEPTDILIDTFSINSMNNGSSSFPDQFGQMSPYRIKQMLLKSGVPHNTTLFLGVILDYQNEISETDETNNGGFINMPPTSITGNVGINIFYQNRSIDIRPNPILNKAIIDVAGFIDNTLTINIMDVCGKIVFEKNDIQFPFVWDRDNLKDGLYLIMIFDSDQAIIRKKIVLN